MADNNNEKDSLFNTSEVKDLAERDVLTSRMKTGLAVIIALFLVIVAHTALSIISMLSDRSVPVVVCPRPSDLDAPVLMKTLDQESLVVQDRWIRGFTRRFVMSLFPRTPQDVKPFYTYVVNHSEGATKRKFQGYVKDSEEIASLVRSFNFYKFYPKNSQDVRIRTVQGYSNRWVVEVDGYLVKRMNVTQERFTPTLRFTVEAQKATIDNPEGLYVIEFENEQITDYVSGRKENL